MKRFAFVILIIMLLSTSMVFADSSKVEGPITLERAQNELIVRSALEDKQLTDEEITELLESIDDGQLSAIASDLGQIDNAGSRRSRRMWTQVAVWTLTLGIIAWLIVDANN